MIVQIQPSSVAGSVQAPASKSSMQRACAAALLAKGTSRLLNPGNSNDDRAALDVIQKLGAAVSFEPGGAITIESAGIRPLSEELNCGESGLGIRMFTPIAALSDKSLTITGSGSLASRPMDFFDSIFPALGIAIGSNNGKLPLKIQGPLRPTNIEVDGSLSSQFLTGLLMAYGAAGAQNVQINVRQLTSKPYIDLTLQVMKQFGVEVINNNYESFYFPKPATGYRSAVYQVEGDWSGGAFLLVAGAVAGELAIKGLDIYSTQADKALLQALKDCGAELSFREDQIIIKKVPLKAFRFNATECPDLFPPLVALAAYCAGESVIEGTGRLTHKESNRALTLQEEFGKMGIDIQLEGDRMIVQGGGPLNGAVVHSHHDHRIAMACAVAALGASGETVIEEADAINKSYPEFYHHLQALGARIPKFEI